MIHRQTQARTLRLTFTNMTDLRNEAKYEQLKYWCRTAGIKREQLAWESRVWTPAMTRVTCEIFTNPTRCPKFVGTNASQLLWFHVQVVMESTWYVLEDLDENS